MDGIDETDVSQAILDAYHAKFVQALRRDVMVVGAGPSGRGVRGQVLIFYFWSFWSNVSSGARGSAYDTTSSVPPRSACSCAPPAKPDRRLDFVGMSRSSRGAGHEEAKSKESRPDPNPTPGHVPSTRAFANCPQRAPRTAANASACPASLPVSTPLAQEVAVSAPRIVDPSFCPSTGTIPLEGSSDKQVKSL